MAAYRERRNGNRRSRPAAAVVYCIIAAMRSVAVRLASICLIHGCSWRRLIEKPYGWHDGRSTDDVRNSGAQWGFDLRTHRYPNATTTGLPEEMWANEQPVIPHAHQASTAPISPQRGIYLLITSGDYSPEEMIISEAITAAS